MTTQTITKDNQIQTAEQKYPISSKIEEDLRILDAVSRNCQMQTASVEFEERDGIPRLKRFSFVAWDHEQRNPTTRKIVVHCGGH
jgi:hypothetical protein